MHVYNNERPCPSLSVKTEAISIYDHNYRYVQVYFEPTLDILKHLLPLVGSHALTLAHIIIFGMIKVNLNIRPRSVCLPCQ